MTVCTPSEDIFPACKSRKIQVDFDGGDVTSDAGCLLLRQMDKKLGLIRSVARGMVDPDDIKA